MHMYCITIHARLVTTVGQIKTMSYQVGLLNFNQYHIGCNSICTISEKYQATYHGARVRSNRTLSATATPNPNANASVSLHNIHTSPLNVISRHHWSYAPTSEIARVLFYIEDDLLTVWEWCGMYICRLHYITYQYSPRRDSNVVAHVDTGR